MVTHTAKNLFYIRNEATDDEKKTKNKIKILYTQYCQMRFLCDGRIGIS